MKFLKESVQHPSRIVIPAGVSPHKYTSNNVETYEDLIISFFRGLKNGDQFKVSGDDINTWHIADDFGDMWDDDENNYSDDILSKFIVRNGYDYVYLHNHTVLTFHEIIDDRHNDSNYWDDEYIGGAILVSIDGMEFVINAIMCFCNSDKDLIIEKLNDGLRLRESIKESFGKKVRAHFECETCFLKYYQDTDEDYFEDEEDFNNVMEDSYLECPRCETENRASYAEVEPEEFTVEEHEYNYKECGFDTEYDDGVEYDEDNDEWYFADDDYDDLDESINKNDKHLEEATTLPGDSLWDKIDEAERQSYKFVHLDKMGAEHITSKEDFWDFYWKVDSEYGALFKYDINDAEKTVYYWREASSWWM